MGGTSTWKYNRPDSSLSRSPSGTSSLSDEGGTSERGVHTPVARDDGSEDEGKLSSNVPNKTMVSRGGMAPGKTTPTNSKSSSENKMVEELTAKVKELEMKLEEKEIKRNREQVLPLPPPPPPPAAATVPIHHYYTRPQSAGVISGGHVVGGVMGRPIHFSGQQHFMQATPFYDPCKWEEPVIIVLTKVLTNVHVYSPWFLAPKLFPIFITFLMHIDVLMLCRKFEIPTNIFQVMSIFKKCQVYKEKDRSPWILSD